MLTVFLFGFVLILSCTVPISYQVIRYVWPQLLVGWRIAASFVVMVLGGFLAVYWIIPAFVPMDEIPTMEFGSRPLGISAMIALVVVLLVFAMIATGATIAQLFRHGLSVTTLVWRIPLALCLGVYFAVLGIVVVLAIWYW